MRDTVLHFVTKYTSTNLSITGDDVEGNVIDNDSEVPIETEEEDEDNDDEGPEEENEGRQISPQIKE